MECGGRAQRRPRFASSTRPRSHTPNGSSNPNRSTALPLPRGEGRGEGKGASNCIVTAKPERYSLTLWSAGAERSGDPALLLLPVRGRIHQTVPPIRIGRRRSLSPGERAGVRGNGASNCIVTAKPERYSLTLWSAGAERSGDPALL